MSHGLPPVIEVVKKNAKKAKFSHEVKLKDWRLARSKIPILKLLQVYTRNVNVLTNFGYEIRLACDIYNGTDCNQIVYLYIHSNKAISDVKTLRKILRFIGFTGLLP